MGKLSGAGAAVALTGFGLPVGIGLIAAGAKKGEFKPHVPDVKPPKATDEEAALARERERKRLSTGGTPTLLSQGKANALSASIGRRLLGGTQ